MRKPAIASGQPYGDLKGRAGQFDYSAQLQTDPPSTQPYGLPAAPEHCGLLSAACFSTAICSQRAY